MSVVKIKKFQLCLCLAEQCTPNVHQNRRAGLFLCPPQSFNAVLPNLAIHYSQEQYWYVEIKIGGDEYFNYTNYTLYKIILCRCIALEDMCNGWPDCPGGTDEHPLQCSFQVPVRFFGKCKID